MTMPANPNRPDDSEAAQQRVEAKVRAAIENMDNLKPLARDYDLIILLCLLGLAYMAYEWNPK